MATVSSTALDGVTMTQRKDSLVDRDTGDVNDLGNAFLSPLLVSHVRRG